MWAVSQNVFCVPVHILDSQSFPGERPSRRRAMRRRKRASLDVLRVPSTRERRYSRSEHRRKRVMRAFAATPSERRAIAERETPYFSWRLGEKRRGGFLPAMARRSLGVAAKARITLLRRYLDLLCRRSRVLGTRRTSSDARLRRLNARRREGRSPG